ncbi:hypothetical protein Tsubulata_029761 [Turnera subulata]|uniref:Uncharacterized protein n=1 Tax=Turnera subulata TaxID=218843 RepID=A0A9Q0EZ73_9ROSI|nr:hypothetical protein Tsubulata_029761 [Turnera subulata]
MAATNLPPKSYFDAMQSVPPLKVTDPRVSRQISAADDPIGLGIFKGHLTVLFYYGKVTKEEGLGLAVAGCIKESLGKAFMEQPILSGRLRRRRDDDDQDGNIGELEIVSNDAGARLIEAKIPISLQEFLDLKERKDLEAELVFWKDLDEQNPQFSPLLYVQVTSFQCGGYSVGISCSLLVADLLVMDNFLNRWSNIHTEVMSENGKVQAPIFYHPNLKPSSFSAHTIISSRGSNMRSTGQTLIFKIADHESITDWREESCKKLASLCIEEAERKISNAQLPLEFSLFMKESHQEVMKVKNFKKDEVMIISKPPLKFKNVVSFSSWDDLGLKEVAFQKGNEPAHTSCWITVPNLGGLVIAIPSPNKAALMASIIVNIPEI